MGVSFPWITPPQQIYSGFLFSSYDGVTGTYLFDIDDVNVNVELYYGSFEGEFNRAGAAVDLSVDEVRGLIISANSGNLSARLSVNQSTEFFADIPGFTQFADALDAAGFSENADSLRFNGSATGYTASVNYDTLDYFLAAEWVSVSSELIVVPEIDAYYLTAGYNFYPFQVHATFSSSDSNYTIPPNEIPRDIAPELDQLAFGYDAFTGSLPRYPLNSVTLGVRYDFRYNVAFKAEVTMLNGEPNQNSFFEGIVNPDFDRKATLYQLGMESFF